MGDLVDLAYPPICDACDSPCPSDTWLCHGCREQLDELEAVASCPLCATPVPNSDAPCGRCLGKGLRPFKSIARLTTMEGVARELIHGVKYRHRWTIMARLAERLLRRELVQRTMASSHVVVPVPMYWIKQLRRGFNQADLLARALARPFALPIARVVRRRNRGKTQTMFHSRAARARNVRDAFRLVDGMPIAGRNVVIVDDVMTSGATLRAVARELRQARPQQITAIVVASAKPMSHEIAPF
jgi:ComF family protein